MSYTSAPTPLLIQNLTQYVSYVNNPAATTTDYQNASRCLAAAFDTLVADTTPANLNAMWTFFVTYHNTYVEENFALVGIGALSPDERFIYELLYSLFRQATNGQIMPSAATMVGNVLQFPVIVEYLQEQAVSVESISGIGNGFPTSGFPIATTSSLGVVEIGTGLSITSGGILSVDPIILSGGVVIDSAAIISSVLLSVEETLGSSSSSASINPATTSSLGVVQIGTGLSITSGGILSMPGSYDPSGAANAVSALLASSIAAESSRAHAAENTLSSALSALGNVSVPIATHSTLGIMQVGTGLSVNGGVVSVTGTFDSAGSAQNVSATLVQEFAPTTILSVNFVFVGKSTLGQVLNVAVTQACTLPADFQGVVFYANTPSTADVTFPVNKFTISTGQLTQIGTVTVTAGTQVQVTPSQQGAITFEPGDTMQMVGEYDNTLADFTFVFPLNKTLG